MKFDKNYFVNGDSNYVDYRQKRFEGLCESLIELGIRPTDTILDIGCATGALLHEFKKQGHYNVRGTDISFWAIEFGRREYGLKPEELKFYSQNTIAEPKDWAIALDVLEHVPPSELETMLNILGTYPPTKGMIVRIPVSAKEGEDFVLDVSKNDRTHIEIHDKEWWNGLFKNYGFEEIDRIQKEPYIWDSEGVLCAVYGRKE